MAEDVELWKHLRKPRMTSSTESAVSVDIIQQARVRKAREAHKRRHTDYATEFYGSTSDKETKRLEGSDTEDFLLVRRQQHFAGHCRLCESSC